MKLSGDLQFKIGLTVVVLAGTGLALWYAKNKLTQVGGQALDAAKAAVPYVDPTDRRNLAYSGVNAVGSAITGDDSWSLGGALYDFDQMVDRMIFGVPEAPAPVLTIEKDFGIANPSTWE